jgi:hypothetical protein
MRIGKAWYQGFQQHDCRHVAYHIAQECGHHGEHRHVLKIPVACEVKHTADNSSVLGSAHNHKQANEEHQQSPINLLIQFVRINGACNQEHRRAERGHRRWRRAQEKPYDHCRHHYGRLCQTRKVEGW